MAISELKQKLLLYELSRISFRDTAYDAATDMIKLEPNNSRAPKINSEGEITYASEYSDFVTDTLWPVVEGINEAVMAWERSSSVPVRDVSNFRVLVEYNNVILAARDDTNLGRGLHYVTWEYDTNRTGVSHGHYTENYFAAKEDFAARSGLVLEAKLFTKEQAAELKASVRYRIVSDEEITYAAEERLTALADRLNDAYPSDETVENTLERHDNRETAPEIDSHIPGAVVPQNEKHGLLLARLEANLADYHDSLMGFGARELIEMADKIVAMSDAYSYMCSNDYSDGELDYLLKFQCPLEVVADEWHRRTDDLSDMSFALDEVFDKQDALQGGYALMPTPPTPATGIITPSAKAKPAAVKPKSLSEKLNSAGEKVKAQSASVKTEISHKREER